MNIDLVTTHESAKELLTYAVPGAIINIEPVWPPESSMRRYSIRLKAAPNHDISQFDTYSLPCSAEQLAKRARKLCDVAAEQLSYKANKGQ